MRIITYKTSYTGTYIYVPVPGTILSSHAGSNRNISPVLEKNRDCKTLYLVSEENREQENRWNIVGSDKPHTGRELEVQEVGKPAPPDIKISSNMFYVLAKQKKAGGFEPPGSNKKNVVLPPSPKCTEKVREDYEKVNVECIRGIRKKFQKLPPPTDKQSVKTKKSMGKPLLTASPQTVHPLDIFLFGK